MDEIDPVVACFARPFQLRLPGGLMLDGAQFPSGRVFIDGRDDTPWQSTYATSLEHALEAYADGVVVWPEDRTELGGRGDG
ncbi:hypothetical protein ACFVH9_07440 [Streptomyces hirsutus]|uniref:hypothetical protein n=1 Tax=Streptomyces hirsutus TaxID=35620 RepID=UPI003644580A